MFLIYGTPDCHFCQKAKTLLMDNDLNFTYQDMSDTYTTTGWRQVFTDLKDKINGQTKIPLIFKSSDADAAVVPTHPLQLDSDKWEFIGDYFILEEFIESLDINLNDKY
jgi:glutaredoxin